MGPLCPVSEGAGGAIFTDWWDSGYMAVHGSPQEGRDGKDRGDRGDTVLITAAQRSYDEQHHARVRKYTILMAFRIPALVIAAVVYSLTGNPWLPLAIIVASIPLPWMAVLIANDSPPQKAEDINHYRYGDASARPAIEPARRNVIDG